MEDGSFLFEVRVVDTGQPSLFSELGVARFNHFPFFFLCIFRFSDLGDTAAEILEAFESGAYHGLMVRDISGLFSQATVMVHLIALDSVSVVMPDSLSFYILHAVWKKGQNSPIPSSYWVEIPHLHFHLSVNGFVPLHVYPNGAVQCTSHPLFILWPWSALPMNNPDTVAWFSAGANLAFVTLTLTR
ncbi:hypothetical protein Nepgr_008798 [Nepenthes gracilis]|uniref:Uncharacterized protein n=1 Tax=Nepenthes gracilis TaxID=150966 RepID=A0AAD3XJL0_NEPGR|nr:hypothetical protein Nepgr_008798 [Nepenthes gracilis]